MLVLFAHGFEGVPTGRKPVYIREKLGAEVIAPSMSKLGWTFRDQVDVLLETLDARRDLRVIVGSSMGGFAAAVAASRRRDRDLRVVLMAPAVGVHRMWADQLGEEGMRIWEEMGTIDYRHQGVDHDVALPYELWRQCRDAAHVIVEHPCVVIHGKADDVIPVEYTLELAKRSPGIRRLHVVDDGHRLLHHLDLMADAIVEVNQ